MPTDRRTTRTQNTLKSALYQLLQTHDLGAITVKSLVAVANTSRSTFYLHFDDIQDLYHHCVADIVDGLFERFETTYPNNGKASFTMLTTQLTDYIDTQRHAMKTLEHVNGTNFIAQIKPRFIQKVLTFEQRDAANVTDYYTVVFSVTGIIGVLVDWLNAPEPAPKATIAHLLMTYIDVI
ncbi:MAG: TetR/AcrR family transcriptional regulator [Leuconostoc sp.]|uniref:TetR/AcrR family transcriptional regulator n=1 Tax=Leuconostoc sp. TaxID=1930076 RepID=UPI0039EAB490